MVLDMEGKKDNVQKVLLSLLMPNIVHRCRLCRGIFFVRQNGSETTKPLRMPLKSITLPGSGYGTNITIKLL